MMDVEAEGRLMERLARGDDRALDALYEALGRNVFALALRMVGSREDAEEVVQDTFVQVHGHAGRFDGRRGSVRAWIYTIARNQCRMHLRARDSRPRSAPERDPHEDGVRATGPSPAARATERLSIQRAFAHLGAEEARLLEAAFFDGYSHGELADREGTPVGTIKSRLRRAMAKARQALTGPGGTATGAGAEAADASRGRGGTS